MKKIVFVTGTRADYGKMKSIIRRVEESPELEAFIYITGMHLLERYGSTYVEVEKDGFRNIHKVPNQREHQHDMSRTTAQTIDSFNDYVKEIRPDLIVVHGDRLEALSGAIVGAFNNVKVAHIEGGEVTGTIDESIRHAITKFSHVHLVSNEEAKKRVLQLGEPASSIHVIGSPDIDIMKSTELKSLDQVRKLYEVPFETYGILIYHPVTTEQDLLPEHSRTVVQAVVDSGKNYIVIYPNNDLGSEIIFDMYKELLNNKRFRFFPSIRFEYFLVFLKNADFMIGNSSAGVRETGMYGIPAIDIGTRQKGRYSPQMLNIQHVGEVYQDICDAIERIDDYRIVLNDPFGEGQSAELFMALLAQETFWQQAVQKIFIDYR